MNHEFKQEPVSCSQMPDTDQAQSRHIQVRGKDPGNRNDPLSYGKPEERPVQVVEHDSRDGDQKNCRAFEDDKELEQRVQFCNVMPLLSIINRKCRIFPLAEKIEYNAFQAFGILGPEDVTFDEMAQPVVWGADLTPARKNVVRNKDPVRCQEEGNCNHMQPAGFIEIHEVPAQINLKPGNNEGQHGKQVNQVCDPLHLRIAFHNQAFPGTSGTTGISSTTGIFIHIFPHHISTSLIRSP